MIVGVLSGSLLLRTPTAQAVTPAMYGRSRRAHTAGRTSPRSQSRSQHAASRRAASRAAWCSNRSAARAPPASRPSPRDGTSPASNSTQPLPPWPPNGSGMPPNPSQTEPKVAGHDRPRRVTRHRHGKKTCHQKATTPCSHPSQNATRHVPSQARRRAGPRTTAHRHGTSRRPVRVVLPDEPPALTPAAARALLRILLKAHAETTGHQEKEARP
jgi:hypothetical protein